MRTETNDVVFTFDTTGSMYPCLTQVRRYVVMAVTSLFARVKNLRIGVIAHGDYCDGSKMISTLDLTRDVDKICQFIEDAPRTGGGDADECYEVVLNYARQLSWTAGNKKALVMIGDCNPHPQGFYHEGHGRVQFDWKNEAKLLVEAGIKIYPVQALGRARSDAFYEKLASLSGTPKLELPQFSDVLDILCGICYHQGGQLEEFQQELRGRIVKPTAHVLRTLAQLSGKPLSQRGEKIGSRFQVIDVDEDCSIREFVTSQGLEFQKGRGFYEFTKREEIQEYKEVVAQNRNSGAIITGKRARSVLGIPEDRANVTPDPEAEHTGFVQSTSVNRKLKAGTKFLYEIVESVDD